MSELIKLIERHKKQIEKLIQNDKLAKEYARRYFQIARSFEPKQKIGITKTGLSKPMRKREEQNETDNKDIFEKKDIIISTNSDNNRTIEQDKYEQAKQMKPLNEVKFNIKPSNEENNESEIDKIIDNVIKSK